MKKTLSIILVVVMLLGCVSVTAFAANPWVIIDGVMVGADNTLSDGKLDNTKFPAIKSGTVTCVNNGGTLKLTLDNVVIDSKGVSLNVYGGWEIELIGSNIVSGGYYTSTSQHNSGFYVYGEVKFSGSGSLLAYSTEDREGAMRSDDHINFSQSPGFVIVGSKDKTERDIINMKSVGPYGNPITVDGGNAQVIVIYKPTASTDRVASGSTGITAFKQSVQTPEEEIPDVKYDIVIPAGITMNKAGSQLIGTPYVKNVQDATEHTIISYTASGTQLTLTGNSEKTMETSYYAYNANVNNGAYMELTNAPINVYENKADVANLLALYVEVTAKDWYEADEGIYTATMTFNFTSKEGDCKEALSDPMYRVDKVYTETVDVSIYVFNESTHELDTTKSYVTTMDKSDFETLIKGSEYKSGDIFHANGESVTKCTATDSHSGLSTLTFKKYVAD